MKKFISLAAVALLGALAAFCIFYGTSRAAAPTKTHFVYEPINLPDGCKPANVSGPGGVAVLALTVVCQDGRAFIGTTGREQ